MQPLNAMDCHYSQLFSKAALQALIALGLFGLIILTFLTETLLAQPPRTRGVERITEVSNAIRINEKFDASQSTGIFVGIRHFEDPNFADVPYAVDDAVDLAHLFSLELRLIRPKAVVLCLGGEPQKAGSQERLRKLLEAGAKRFTAKSFEILGLLEKLPKNKGGPAGLIVVSFATHGFSHDSNDFILASDSLRHRMTSTGLTLDKVLNMISKAESPRRLVLLDTCRHRLSPDRTLSEQSAAMSVSFAEAIAKAHGQIVLSGTVQGGYAYDDQERGNGVFTGAVLDGLQGHAPADERGFITIRQLAGFVEDQVILWVKRHRPEHVEFSKGISISLETVHFADMPLAITLQHPPIPSPSKIDNFTSQGEIDFSGEWKGICHRHPYIYAIQLVLSRSYENAATRFEGQIQVEPLVTSTSTGASSKVREHYEVTVEFNDADQSLLILPDEGLRPSHQAIHSAKMDAVYSGQDDTIAGIFRGWPTSSSPFFVFRRSHRAETLFGPARRSMKPAKPGRTPLEALGLNRLRTRNVEEERIYQWASKFSNEYPEIDPYHTIIDQLRTMTRKLFRDSHFTTQIGKPYDKLTQAECKRIWQILRMKRSESEDTFINYSPFAENFVSARVADVTVSVLALRSIETWYKQMHYRLENLQMDSNAQHFLVSLEAQVDLMEQALWPSEVRELKNRVRQIRQEVK